MNVDHGCHAHECSVYCRDGLHATLAYQSPGATMAHLIDYINTSGTEMVGFGRVRVVDYFPAQEAPIPPHLVGRCAGAWVLLVRPVEQEVPP